MKRRIVAQIGAVCACAVAILSGTAFAYFSSTGSGSAAAAVTTLGAPTISTATAAAGGTVAVTWGAVTAPGSGTVKYFVTRNGEEAEGNCPTQGEAEAVTTCTDSGLGPGTYEYKVTAVWNSWTKTGAGKSATVSVGVTTKFTVTASSTTPSTGVADNLTVTAKDSAGATVTTFTGSHNIVFAGAEVSEGGKAPTVINASGTAIAFGEATALTFTNGVASVASSKNGVMQIYDPGEAKITATEGSLTTPVPLVVNVLPTATRFVLSASSTTPAAGTAVDLTIKAYDAYGNLSTNYTGSHSLTFAGASSSPGGNAPTVENSSGTPTAFGTATALTFTAGVSTVTGGKNGEMILYKIGETSITATESSVTTPTPLVVTVTSTATRFALTASTTTPASGASVSLTIKANDIYGNVVTSYTGSHNLTFSGASASPGGNTPTVKNTAAETIPFGSATALNFIAGSSTVTESKNGVMILYKAGETSITATEGSITTPTPLVENVLPNASRFVLGAATTNPAVGTFDGLTITAYDAYGNLSTNYTGTKNLVFSGPAASPGGTAATVENASGSQIAIGSTTTITFKEGVAAASESGSGGELKVYKSGAATLSVKEGSTVTTPTALSLTVTPGAAASLTLSASPTSFTAGTASSFTTVAKDAYGNVATGFASPQNLVYTATGTAAETSPGGNIPGVSNSAGTQIVFGSATETTFVGGEAKVSSTKNGVLHLYKAGTASITVTNGTLTSAAVAFTVTPNTAKKLAFTSFSASPGTVSNPCYTSCTVTGLTNTGTITSKVSIVDEYGNIVSAVGASKSVTIAATGTSGSTVTGSPLTIPATGAAESSTSFTFKPPTSGSYTNTITASATGYTSATITASK